MTTIDETGARVAPPDFRQSASIQPIIPQTFKEALEYADFIIAAGLAPDSYNFDRDSEAVKKDPKLQWKPDPQKVAIGILKSLEIGVPPLTGIANIAIINKRPSIWGDLAYALVQRSGKISKLEVVTLGRERVSEAKAGEGGEIDHAPKLTDFPDGFGYHVKLWRHGPDEPVLYEWEFTVRDARRQGLWLNSKRQPWIIAPKRMLYIRALAPPMRTGFADCLAGLSIREEEEDTLAGMGHNRGPALDERPKMDTAFLRKGVDPAALPKPSGIIMPTVVGSGVRETVKMGAAPVEREIRRQEVAAEVAEQTQTAEPDGAPGSPPAQGEAAPVAAPPGRPVDDGPMVPMTMLENGPDWKGWCMAAAAAIRECKTPREVERWMARHEALRQQLISAGPQGVAWHKRLIEVSEEREGDLRAGM